MWEEDSYALLTMLSLAVAAQQVRSTRISLTADMGSHVPLQITTTCVHATFTRPFVQQAHFLMKILETGVKMLSHQSVLMQPEHPAC